MWGFHHYIENKTRNGQRPWLSKACLKRCLSEKLIEAHLLGFAFPSTEQIQYRSPALCMLNAEAQRPKAQKSLKSALFCKWLFFIIYDHNFKDGSIFYIIRIVQKPVHYTYTTFSHIYTPKILAASIILRQQLSGQCILPTSKYILVL